MEKNSTAKGSFVVTIVSRQNATWQGTVTWLDKKEMLPFRSTLELIRMIESTVSKEGELRKFG